ncbi:MAG TPA: PVC-type heme-binding CxxCH protein [Prosthecobacter sp.]|nr:PVC-type heme-binding CxxCH protein [Prosthecobacter sp.]
MKIAVLTVVFISLWVSLTSFGQAPKKKGISVGEPPPDHSPEAELASFKVLDGIKVNLFASEADGVPNPLVLRWDERGRLWVISTTAYPQPEPGEPCDDKILILEDTDQDGRADKFTVFAGGLRMPTGMELAGPGEVYVGEGEKLWLFKDTNGDDRVDEKEVIFSGFGTGDTHQNINSFIWAPDGALVMHQGLHCYSRVATPWGVKQLYGSGFWRFWPRSRKLEAYPTGMPANPWGTAFTKWGQPIMVAGAAGMFWARPMEISVPEIQTENSQPYFLLTRFMLPFSGQIIKTSGLRKFCGVDIAGHANWPKDMQEELVSGGFFENAVFRYKIVDDRLNPSGFEAVEQPPLITSDNVAFRPVDIRFGPEGALYVADWYDPIIGHYQASFRHPNRDKVHGRIWRVATKDLAAVSRPPDLAKLNPEELILKIRDPGFHPSEPKKDRWSQYQAQRLIAAGIRSGRRPLKDWSKYVSTGSWKGNTDAIRHLRLRLQELAEEPSLDEIDDTYLHQAAEGHRSYAAHALGDWASHLRDPLSYARAFIADKEPRVRLEAIVACAKMQHPDAIKVALMALDKPMDSFLDRTLWLAVHGTSPQWKNLASPAELMKFLSSLPSHHLAYLVQKDGSSELLNAVRQMVKEQTLPPETKRALHSALLRSGDAADVLNALRLGQKDAVLLTEVTESARQLRGAAPEGAEAVLRELIASGDIAQRTAASNLIGAWRMVTLKEDLLKLPVEDETLRAAAFAARMRLEPGIDLPWIKDTWPVRIAVLEALAETRQKAAGAVAAESLSAVPDEPTMRAWLAPLLSREAAVQAFVTAVKTNPCSPEAAKLALATLAASGRSDPTVTGALSAILGVKNTVPGYDPAWVSALSAEVKAEGDSTAGKAIFQAPLSGCVACHQINKQGGTIGPELDFVGRGVPLELIIEAVVWPNRQIKEGYVSTTLALTDGRRLQGYKVSEANGELHLRDFLTGTVSRFPNAQIKERQEAGSLMPEGLIMNMKRTELRDLIAYLASLGG